MAQRKSYCIKCGHTGLSPLYRFGVLRFHCPCGNSWGEETNDKRKTKEVT